MGRGSRCLSSLLLAAAFAFPLATTACSGHYRVYDTYYGDYHHWDHHEEVYYNQWEVETHRDHRDFKDRKADEQKEYWQWRHNHH